MCLLLKYVFVSLSGEDHLKKHESRLELERFLIKHNSIRILKIEMSSSSSPNYLKKFNQTKLNRVGVLFDSARVRTPCS